MPEATRTITVTEEEYQMLLAAREQLARRRKLEARLEALPGGKRGTEFALGAVAGFAAHYLYSELIEDEVDEVDEKEEAPSKRPRPPRRGRSR